MDQREIEQLTERAREALRKGDDVRAVAIADQLLGAVPDDPLFHAIRAQGLLSSDNVQDAFAEAQLAAELNPHDASVCRVLGLAAWRYERLTLAQESLERAIALSGRNPQLLAEYAWFMASQRGPRLAETAAQQAVQADEASSTAWTALGLAQYRLRRRGEAERSFRRALELDPKDLQAQAAMATLLQEQGKDAQAEVLAELLDGSPGTQQLVESIRRQAKQRQIAKMLVERNALPEPPAGQPPRRSVAWLLFGLMMIAGMLGLLVLLLLWFLQNFSQ